VQRLGKVEYALFKPRWNVFHRTPLNDHLQKVGVDTVVSNGCNFSNCPRATLFGASERDYRAVLVTDAVSQFHPHARAELYNLGIVTVTIGEILAQLTATFPTSSPPGRSAE
jgi:nicotinamidase-related amidase